MKIKNNKVVTSTDVARLAGVSQSSVSRVFNPSSAQNVKPDIREKVLKAANELKYKPNFIARSMSSGKTNIIGLVIRKSFGPFYTTTITKLICEIEKIGKQCLVFSTESTENIENIVERVLQFQVDAIVVTAPALSKEVVDMCSENQTPIILFNRFSEGLNISSVYCDHIQGGKLAAEYLVNSAHKNFAFIGHEKDSISELEKKMGFYGKLREGGIYNIIEEKTDYTYEAGYKIGEKILSMENAPNAIFCTSDTTAVGIMDVARHKFLLKIPEDISIVGFDNILMAGWESYNLTTIEQPIETLIKETIAIIEKLTEHKSKGCITKVIKLKIIERKSVLK